MPLREHAIEPWANLSHAEKAARYQGVEQMATRIIELMPSGAIRDACQTIKRVSGYVAAVHTRAALVGENNHTAGIESAPFLKCGALADASGLELLAFVGYRETYLCLLRVKGSGSWIVAQWDHNKNVFFALYIFDTYNEARDAFDERKET